MKNSIKELCTASNQMSYERMIKIYGKSFTWSDLNDYYPLHYFLLHLFCKAVVQNYPIIILLFITTQTVFKHFSQQMNVPPFLPDEEGLPVPRAVWEHTFIILLKTQRADCLQWVLNCEKIC